MTARTFGVEIEVVGLNEEEATEVLKAAGIELYDPDRKFEKSEFEHGWTVGGDASVVPTDESDGTCEVVSPILSGLDGLRQVEIVCQALKNAGAYVNSSCGFHVHIDAEDLTFNEVFKVYDRYSCYENVIGHCLPPNRTNNSYCASIKGNVTKCYQRNIGHIDTVMSTRDKKKLGFAFDRYRTVNLESINKYGTIEFRHHHGTVEANAATAWVKFCLNFVERSILINKNPRRKIRDTNPWIGLDTNTRKYFISGECKDLYFKNERYLTSDEYA
jgi:hypothetical protein